MKTVHKQLLLFKPHRKHTRWVSPWVCMLHVLLKLCAGQPLMMFIVGKTLHCLSLTLEGNSSLLLFVLFTAPAGLDAQALFFLILMSPSVNTPTSLPLGQVTPRVAALLASQVRPIASHSNPYNKKWHALVRTPTCMETSGDGNM